MEVRQNLMALQSIEKNYVSPGRNGQLIGSLRPVNHEGHIRATGWNGGQAESGGSAAQKLPGVSGLALCWGTWCSAGELFTSSCFCKSRLKPRQRFGTFPAAELFLSFTHTDTPALCAKAALRCGSSWLPGSFLATVVSAGQT